MNKKFMSLLMAATMMSTSTVGVFATESGAVQENDQVVSEVANESVQSVEVGTIDDLETKLAGEGTLEIVLTNSIAFTKSLSVIGNKTITGKEGISLNRGEVSENPYKGTFFQVEDNASLTFDNVQIDAGGKWTFNSEALEEAKKKSKVGNNAIDNNNGLSLVNQNGGIETESALINLNNGSVYFTNGTVVKNIYSKKASSIINVLKSSEATLNTRKIVVNNSVIQNNTSASPILANVADGSGLCSIEISGTSRIFSNYSSADNGGLVYLRNGSLMTIEDNAVIQDNVAYNCNGLVAISYGAGTKVEMNGGTVQNNTGLTGKNNHWNQPFYTHSEGSFVMNDGSIINNIGGWAGAVGQNGGDGDSILLKGGTISGNQFDEITGDNTHVGEIVIGSKAKTNGAIPAVISENFTTTGKVCVWGEGQLLNLGTISGELEIVDYTVGENSYESIVVNRGDITGKVELDPGCEMYFGNSTYKDYTDLPKVSVPTEENTTSTTLKVKKDSEGNCLIALINGQLSLEKGAAGNPEVVITDINGNKLEKKDKVYEAAEYKEITLNPTGGTIQLENDDWTVVEEQKDFGVVGQTISFTLKPDYNYQLNTLLVTSNGKSVEVKSDRGIYSFTMPDGDVIITASFVAIQTPPAGSGSEDQKDPETTDKPVENEDGSKTETTTDESGNKVEITTDFPEETGKKTETVTTNEKAGTVEIKTEALDGTVATVTESKNDDTVNAVVEIPETAISSTPEESAALVEVKMPEIPADRKGDEVKVEINLPETAEEAVTEVVIPVANENPGSVAYLIDENGNEILITASNAKEGKISIPLTTSGKVVIKDNSKSFTDLGSNYDKSVYPGSGVAYTSARGIMNGQGDGSFDLEGVVTRGMIARILYNLAGNPSVEGQSVPAGVGDNWYTDAATWAASTGLMAQGSNFRGQEDLTREQLAMILWRYEGQPDSSNYSLDGYKEEDRASISSPEMEKAVKWAVENHILGQGSGINGQGNGKRGDIANMLYRYLAKVNPAQA